MPKRVRVECKLCGPDGLQMLGYGCAAYECPACGGRGFYYVPVPRLDPPPPGRVVRLLRAVLAAVAALLAGLGASCKMR